MSSPPPPPEETGRPPVVVCALPLLAVDGNPVVGAVDMLVKLTDGDVRIELEIDGKRGVVDGRHLVRILGSLVSMLPSPMYMAGPVVGRGPRYP